MTELRQLATDRPVLFSCLVVVVFILFVIVAGVLAYGAGGGVSSELLAAAVKLVGAFVLVAVVRRLGWLRATGIGRLGGTRAWLIAVPAIVYSIIVSQLAFFGSVLPVGTAIVAQAGTALNMLVDGGLQELAFRGVILYALVRVWGGSRRGLIASVIVSSALFGGAHILNVLVRGRALPVVLLQIAETILSGITYAALVLYGGTIWPVVLWHGLLNAAVSATAVGIPGFEETASMWAWSLLANLPLVAYGGYWISRLPHTGRQSPT
jgi:hypothetical protein